MRLLIAEDDYEMAKILKTLLEHNNYSVDTVDNGADALDYVLYGSYDGIILDIMMPAKDGLSVVKELRRAGRKIPVLMLSARGELSDRVDGLDAGADDYLAKPFSTTELLARVRALLRRGETYTGDVLSVGNLSLNCVSYEFSTPSGSLHLNNKEFQILEYLMRSPHTAFSAETLMDRIWGWNSATESSVVWTNIAYLRKKFRLLSANVEIRLVRGAGYYLHVL